MKKFFTFLAMMSLAVLPEAMSQNITLKFTGATTSGDYVQLDSVRVQNVSRSWSETLTYPDTVLSFQQTGIADAQGIAAELSSYPNPANGVTNVTVAMPRSGEATLQLYNLAGQRVAERTMTLQAGENLFEVRLQNAHVYLLAVTTGQGRSTIKLLNRGDGTENSILFRGNVNAAEKRLSTHIFQIGDVLKIVGYATHNGSVVLSSEIQQPQGTSENFTLIFAHPVSFAFSVSAITRVLFSPGNLQWSATNGGSSPTTHAVAGGGTAAGTWRFAPNQWDAIGAANSNASSTYSGWIDLFGWGTSGYNSKFPYMTSTANTDYGNGNTNISGTNYDWGVYNAIYNPRTQTTDPPDTWRTLTKDEWAYLINTRSTTSGIRYAKATVNGVAGLIIVPDSWSSTTYALNSTNTTGAAFTANVISASQWVTLENAGCAFFPAAGNRLGASVYYVGSNGNYWSAANYGSGSAYVLYFVSVDVYPSNYGHRYGGLSVRLVQSAQ